MAEVLASCILACHEIATQSYQQPMRLDRSGFCVSLAIDNTHFERSAQGLDQNVGDLGFHRDLWAWPRHLAQRGKDRLRIGFGPQRITWREARYQAVS